MLCFIETSALQTIQFGPQKRHLSNDLALKLQADDTTWLRRDGREVELFRSHGVHGDANDQPCEGDIKWETRIK